MNMMNMELMVRLVEACEKIADRLSYGDSERYPTIAEEIHILGDKLDFERLNGHLENIESSLEDISNV